MGTLELSRYYRIHCMSTQDAIVVRSQLVKLGLPWAAQWSKMGKIDMWTWSNSTTAESLITLKFSGEQTSVSVYENKKHAFEKGGFEPALVKYNINLQLE